MGPVMLPKGERIVVLGDTHFPFHHHGALEWALSVIEDRQPTMVVQIGDLYDMFSMSRFARSVDLMVPKQEVADARMLGEGMWKRIRSKTKAKCYQLWGNHDSRPIKSTLEKFPEIASLVDITHLWKFPGVTTLTDERQELLLHGIAFMHGYRTKLGDHAKYNLMPTVHGHTHRGGVVFFPYRNQMIWELDVGYLGDADSAALSYTKQRLVNWTMGIGIVDSMGPRFCPYPDPSI